MKLVDDWWVADIMSGASSYVRRAQSLYQQLERVRTPRVAVQAGGHIGVYPKIIAQKFERVYTFEPDRENFECLTRNVALPNVYAARGILGNERGCMHLDLNQRSSGGHNVSGAGHLPTYRIDDLHLDHCDALFLDVEGYEIHVLRGALATIARHRPLIVAEENKKLHGQGFQFGDIERLLAPLGYELVERSGEDIVLVHTKGAS